MRINNLKFNKGLIANLLSTSLMLSFGGGTVYYYRYNHQQQVQEQTVECDNIFTDENGRAYRYFLAGEHVIKISSNDLFYRKFEEVEGYTIKEVEINGYRDNNKVVYVNTEPVYVFANQGKDGNLEFNNFGELVVPKFHKK